MPTIKRFSRCRIEVRSNEHPPPHFHVVTNSGEDGAYLIETAELWMGEPDPRDTREALEWAQRWPGELRREWQRLNEQEP